MGSAALASLTAVLGLVVGRYWDYHSESRKWLRDQRIRIYEELAGAYYETREAYREVALAKPGTSNAEQASRHALDVNLGNSGGARGLT